MKLGKIIKKVKENDLQNPLRAGIEKQAILNELMDLDKKNVSLEDVENYLDEHFTDEDAKDLKKNLNNN